MKTIQKKEKWTCGYCEKSGTERKFMEQHHCSNPVKPLSQKEPEEWEKEALQLRDWTVKVLLERFTTGKPNNQYDVWFDTFVERIGILLSQQRTQTIEEIKKLKIGGYDTWIKATRKYGGTREEWKKLQYSKRHDEVIDNVIDSLK